jgi:hypothetical protein
VACEQLPLKSNKHTHINTHTRTHTHTHTHTHTQNGTGLIWLKSIWMPGAIITACLIISLSSVLGRAEQWYIILASRRASLNTVAQQCQHTVLMVFGFLSVPWTGCRETGQISRVRARVLIFTAVLYLLTPFYPLTGDLLESIDAHDGPITSMEWCPRKVKTPGATAPHAVLCTSRSVS